MAEAGAVAGAGAEAGADAGAGTGAEWLHCCCCCLHMLKCPLGMRVCLSVGVCVGESVFLDLSAFLAHTQAILQLLTFFLAQVARFLLFITFS